MGMVIPIIFFLMAISLVAQASITIKTYRDTKKAHDMNYTWSSIVLALAIVGLLISMYLIYRASSQAKAAAAAAPPPVVAPSAN
jgi:uncharacterized membrane protein YhaH (DUF805 family)